MHCLEVIVQRNAQVKPSRNCDSHYEVTAFAGVITIHNLRTGTKATIDASNPLNETELLNFHQNWVGPKWVAFKVEYLASHWRQMLQGGEPSYDEVLHRCWNESDESLAA
jgi:hypothetical protein